MKQGKVFIAGHRGMVGSAIFNELKSKGYTDIITRTRSELDLLNQESVNTFFKSSNIDYVVICAAKVGGILANNTYRGDFIYENLQIASNIIKSSHDFNVKKLINLGSSCIYPRESRIPIKEEYLLTGPLEYTNEPYAVAKIAALKMCESFYKQHGDNFFSIMPCNLYGPKDNFDLKSSHVLPALINKIHCAKLKGSLSINVWGSGKPLREFLYVSDLAKAAALCLESIDASSVYESGISHLNCGSNDEVSIVKLVNIIKNIIEYHGDIVFDSSKPDGTFRKKMDNTRIHKLGFRQDNDLKQGVEKTYDWYIKNVNIDC